MGFAERLHLLRTERNLSLSDVSRRTGLARSTINMYEKGNREPKIETLELFADLFNVDMDYLIGKSETKRRQTVSVDEIAESNDIVQIPVYGEIAAGLPILAEQIILDYESIPAEMARSGEYFGLQVKGNSMEPQVLSGDVVILRKTEEFVSGSVCAVMVNGEEATLKKVLIRQGGITLIPFNAIYPPINFSKDQISALPVRCFGVVVELRRKM